MPISFNKIIVEAATAATTTAPATDAHSQNSHTQQPKKEGKKKKSDRVGNSTELSNLNETN